MSLLMDALKKAEEEKKKAAAKLKNAEMDEIAGSADEAPERGASAHEPAPGPESPLPPYGPEEAGPAEATGEVGSGELALEPLPREPTFLSEASRDDTAPRVHQARHKTAATGIGERALSDSPTVMSARRVGSLDKDATLPSERAIRASLKDYFEASQSISMERNRVDLPGTRPPPPVDTGLAGKTTHVTANTIFTTQETRTHTWLKAGITIFATLAIGAGLMYWVYQLMFPPTPMFPSPGIAAVPLPMPAVEPAVSTPITPDTGTAPVEPPPAVTPVEPPVVELQAPSELPLTTELAAAPQAPAGTLSPENITAALDSAADLEQPPAAAQTEAAPAQGVQTVQRKPAEFLVQPGAIKITRGAEVRNAANVWLASAYKSFKDGDYRLARKHYTTVLEHHPDNRDALLGLAAISVQQRDLEQAYRHYLYLLRLNPKDIVANAAVYNLQSLAGGDIDESGLKLLLDGEPSSAQAHFSLANNYARKSRWIEAQQAYFHAFSADNRNAVYAFNLAVSLEHLGKQSAALDYYQKARALSSNSVGTLDQTRLAARIETLSKKLGL